MVFVAYGRQQQETSCQSVAIIETLDLKSYVHVIQLARITAAALLKKLIFKMCVNRVLKGWQRIVGSSGVADVMFVLMFVLMFVRGQR